VISLGGRFGYKDQGQTANTQIAVLDFGDTELIFEVRGLPTKEFVGEKVGNIAHLEGGVIAGGNRKSRPMFYPNGSTKGEDLPRIDVERGPGHGNFGNFIAAVRSRKISDLNADILVGHYSAALCHLANISYRLGQELPLSKTSKAFGDDKVAYETLERMQEHLKDNGMTPDGLTYRVGPELAFDARSESFVDAPEASKLLTREYRKPYLVPESIAVAPAAGPKVGT
jgi:hypothetical protein